MLKLGNREEKDFTNELVRSAPIIPVAPVGLPVNNTGETIIGEHITIEGTIRASENIIIEGTMVNLAMNHVQGDKEVSPSKT